MVSTNSGKKKSPETKYKESHYGSKIWLGRVRAMFRQMWMMSKERHTALANAKIAPGVWKCSTCAKELKLTRTETRKGNRAYRMKDFSVDHIEPVGFLNSLNELNEFLNRLFLGPQRVLCKECHDDKTAKEKAGYAAQRKIISNGKLVSPDKAAPGPDG